METEQSLLYKGIIAFLLVLPMAIVFLHVFNLILQLLLGESGLFAFTLYGYALFIAAGYFIIIYREYQIVGDNSIIYKRGNKTLRELPYDSISDLKLSRYKIHEWLNIGTLIIRRNDTKKKYILNGMKNYQAIYEHIQARMK